MDKHLYDQMHLRLKTPYAKKMKKRRQATVEPVLGTLINFMGIRRIWTRGLKSANKFMLGAAIAYNLKKWLNYTEATKKTAVIALPPCSNKLKKTEEDLWSWLFALRCTIDRHTNKPAYHFTFLLK